MGKDLKTAAWNPLVAEARADSDFFPTEEDISHAFIDAEMPWLIDFDKIYEPACGDGAISRVLKSYGFRVPSTDLVYRGYGRGGVDFTKVKRLPAPAIFTNPPYKDELPATFLRHAKKLGAVYVAMLLKCDFFNSFDHALLWNELPPSREYKITWRPDFLDLGGGRTNVCIWVWDWRRPAPSCITRLLFRPDKKKGLVAA